MGAALLVDGDSDRRSRGLARLRAAWLALPPLERGLSVLGATSMAVAGGVWVPLTPFALATVLSGLVLTAAAVVDVAEHRLPNELVITAAAPVLVAVLASAVAGSDAWSGAVVAVALVGVPLFATHLVSPAGLGFGDVKAATVLAGGLGLVAPVVAVAALVVGLLVTAVHALAGRHRAVALGPGLVVGAIVALGGARLAGVASW